MRGFGRISVVVFCGLFVGAAENRLQGQTTDSTGPTTLPRVQSVREIRRARVASLVADAHKLYELGQLNEALDLLRQATIIDPEDENAALFFRLVMDKRVDRLWGGMQEGSPDIWSFPDESRVTLATLPRTLPNGTLPAPANAKPDQALIGLRLVYAPQAMLRNFKANWNVPEDAPAAAAGHAESAPDGIALRAALVEKSACDQLLKTFANNSFAYLFRPLSCAIAADSAAQLGVPASQSYVAAFDMVKDSVEPPHKVPKYAQTDTGIEMGVGIAMPKEQRGLSLQLKLTSTLLTRMEEVAPPNIPGTSLRVGRPVIQTTSSQWTSEVKDNQVLVVDAGPVDLQNKDQHLYVFVSGAVLAPVHAEGAADKP